MQELLRSQRRGQRDRHDPDPERQPGPEPPAAPRDAPRHDATAARRARGSESAEGSGGLNPAELTSIQCKNVPDHLNDRTVLEKHFGQFGKVRRVLTRRNKKMAVVHFFDHVSIESDGCRSRRGSKCPGQGLLR
ncbi:germinal-center associated nuclear protein-like [Cuculus canorus]|uniref:germinal-center associated nuclear protein-like n=1 Tax=Cuculus canorus TaxID=55661 RepID=UPI0023AB428E|nr:germinal-center associated nuclear protein-like [Cuculus canorus]